MRNPAVKIKTWPRSGPNPYKILTESEQRFLDMIIDGRNRYEAAVESGMLSKDLPKNKIQDRCRNFLQTLRAKKYLAENAKTVRLMTEREYDIVRTHMYEIAMGTAVRKTVKLDKEGCEHNIEESPSFRDQVSAANWLLSDLRDKRNRLEKTPAQEMILNDIDEIERKTNDLVSKYSYRPIEIPDSRKMMESVIDIIPEPDENVPDFIPDGRAGGIDDGESTYTV